ncbi:hypothetical protein TRFO_14265 [Tritrichomonas foetus]|uniref:Uncharacterized protein n=1 Tax=Tritrichomonas foetus TaxID=1144522 RepID=A0A1J4KZV9_9EUKA|nr:hypothetical protein TRFO_14265 [Tritrichomonas foetus]|eukprot:OHT15238.1 hypothetical protein TRFO_14265 [Tritrichomonas foetus]
MEDEENKFDLFSRIKGITQLMKSRAELEKEITQINNAIYGKKTTSTPKKSSTKLSSRYSEPKRLKSRKKSPNRFNYRIDPTQIFEKQVHYTPNPKYQYKNKKLISNPRKKSPQKTFDQSKKAGKKSISIQASPKKIDFEDLSESYKSDSSVFSDSQSEQNSISTRISVRSEKQAEKIDHFLFFKQFQLKSRYYDIWYHRWLRKNVNNFKSDMNEYNTLSKAKNKVKKPEEKIENEIKRRKKRPEKVEKKLVGKIIESSDYSNFSLFNEKNRSNNAEKDFVYHDTTDQVNFQFIQSQSSLESIDSSILSNPPIYDSENVSDGPPMFIKNRLPYYQVTEPEENSGNSDPPLFFDDSSENSRFIQAIQVNNEANNIVSFERKSHPQTVILECDEASKQIIEACFDNENHIEKDHINSFTNQTNINSFDSIENDIVEMMGNKQNNQNNVYHSQIEEEDQNNIKIENEIIDDSKTIMKNKNDSIEKIKSPVNNQKHQETINGKNDLENIQNIEEDKIISLANRETLNENNFSSSEKNTESDLLIQLPSSFDEDISNDTEMQKILEQYIQDHAMELMEKLSSAKSPNYVDSDISCSDKSQKNEKLSNHKKQQKSKDKETKEDKESKEGKETKENKQIKEDKETKEDKEIKENQKIHEINDNIKCTSEEVNERISGHEKPLITSDNNPEQVFLNCQETDDGNAKVDIDTKELNDLQNERESNIEKMETLTESRFSSSYNYSYETSNVVQNELYNINVNKIESLSESESLLSSSRKECNISDEIADESQSDFEINYRINNIRNDVQAFLEEGSEEEDLNLLIDFQIKRKIDSLITLPQEYEKENHQAKIYKKVHTEEEEATDFIGNSQSNSYELNYGIKYSEEKVEEEYDNEDFRISMLDSDVKLFPKGHRIIHSSDRPIFTSKKEAEQYEKQNSIKLLSRKQTKTIFGNLAESDSECYSDTEFNFPFLDSDDDSSDKPIHVYEFTSQNQNREVLSSSDDDTVYIHIFDPENVT